MRTKNIAICRGHDALRDVASSLLPPGFALIEFSSVLECHQNGILNQASVLLVPEFLPECPGLALVELIRKNCVRAPLIWFVTADNMLREEAFKAGADDYFILPFAGEFVSKLRHLLRADTADLSGRLSTFTPFSLIQFLNSAQATGELEISGRVPCRLVFHAGELINAVMNGLHGEAVVLELLKLSTEGLSFEFRRSDSVGAAKTIQKRTDHLLLSLASALDEAA